MFERDFEIGLHVEICNHGDFAMTHKKYIGRVGVIEKRTKKGLVYVRLDEKNAVACPLKVLKVVTKEEVVDKIISLADEVNKGTDRGKGNYINFEGLQSLGIIKGD